MSRSLSSSKIRTPSTHPVTWQPQALDAPTTTLSLETTQGRFLICNLRTPAQGRVCHAMNNEEGPSKFHARFDTKLKGFVVDVAPDSKWWPFVSEHKKNGKVDFQSLLTDVVANDADMRDKANDEAEGDVRHKLHDGHHTMM